MGILTLAAAFLLLSSHGAFAAGDLPPCEDTSNSTFDYVVVGAGAGGGPLAKSVLILVVDAGHDALNINTTIPLYFIRAIEDLQTELNYTLDEYPPGFQFQKNDAWYPRARAVGGSTIHNALINIIAETKTDFDNLAAAFNDSTWSRDNMQNYFKRIEHNLYTVDPVNHGYDGWLFTNLNPDLTVLNPMFLDVQTVAFFATLVAAGLPPILDLNDLVSDQAIGGTMPSFTIDADHTRSSVRDRLVNVNQSESASLHFALDTLATRILLCNSSSGTPTAYGVEIAPGAALPVASNFQGKTSLWTENITVKHEVISSAGVFQSPQLLMLSGIGNSSQLEAFGINPILDLPGVGNNLQDHDEIAVIWRMKQNFSVLNGCVLEPDPKQDPCLQFWEDNDHLNVYSFGGAVEAFTAQSADSSEPDVMTYWEPAYFLGFVRGFVEDFLDNKNAVTAVHLKAHPSTRGTVQLTGSHPQDPLNIQKLHFQAENGPKDVADLREAIKRSRAVMESLTILPFVQEEIFPGPQAQTDDEIDAHIYENIFGHHACCTNPIGMDNDSSAVLDGDFKVKGVNNLRVVDASSWPNVPGWFICTPTYMISEKAADIIIASLSAQ
ncbi:alcohol oxidase [Lentinula raphanica]|uniref:Alcohol oxidase n=1 Tax=Lentinula raphanica TaxID=153919 RepID=A0AA38PIX7_9AGAR|nr:alcohol oxidase [Lentinula raphanica]